MWNIYFSNYSLSRLRWQFILGKFLNTWLHVPPTSIKTITSIANTLPNASLILDDLQENSPLRRGFPSAHVLFSPAQSINSATFMFVRAVGWCLAHRPAYRAHILGVVRQRPTAASSDGSPLSRECKAHLTGCPRKGGALAATLGCLRDLERELEAEIDRLEGLAGEANPMLRLCLAKLSVKGMVPLG